MRISNSSLPAEFPTEIPEVLEITDPDAVRVLFHEKKQAILERLIQKEEKIIDLKTALKMNPGTIKRHLDDLLAKGLICPPRIQTNQFGIKEKYYRAVARKFIVHIEWPE